MKDTNVSYKKKEECCACTACKYICPKNAIKMKEDEKGFLYPIVDDNLCIECGLCKKVCAFNENYIKDTLLENPIIYGAINKDEEERKTSRSGGAFMAFSNWILENNGVVYGASYDEKFNVHHRRINNKESLYNLKGSKYVQSELRDSFINVKDDLISGRKVLFSGTPCQVAGIRKYLGNLNKSQNFYTCDIVCHGVPSPKVWKKYLDFIESKFHKKINKVDFRDKSFGWRDHKESFFYGSKNKITTTWYVEMFYKNLNLRNSCNNCYYTNTNRPSDITIGDFWGIEKAIKEMDDNKGTSLVIVNTAKGKELFDRSKDMLNYKETQIDKCMQPNLKNPTAYNKDTEEFFRCVNNDSFENVLKKYSSYNFKTALKTKIKIILRRSNENNKKTNK